MISETALQVAVDLAAWFVRTGYPYLGKPTLDLDGGFPLVMVWDDARELALVIACTESAWAVHDAVSFADKMARVLEGKVRDLGAETSALGMALHAGNIYINNDSVISSRPIKHILGGE